MQAEARSGLERWQDGLNKGVDDPAWSAYDCELKTAVSEFNRHLARTPNFRKLDWRLIKSMLWVETGAASPEWKTRPMQIGVPGDPGLTALLSDVEGGDLILYGTWRKRLTVGTVRTLPTHNIHAGIAYLLMRLAIFEHKSVVDPRSTGAYKVTVQAGDSLAKIAKKHGSTIDIHKQLNGPSSVLKPGQILKVEKGSIMRVITGWRLVSTATIAQRYNGGGDPLYANKLEYAFGLVKNGKEASCQ
jgi:LysM repeat protein